MSARGYLRGWAIYWDGDYWRYTDSNEKTVGSNRPCGFCNQHRTPEGHDPCLGTLPGVMNACCGHGQDGEAYLQYSDGNCLRGGEAIREICRLKLISKN